MPSFRELIKASSGLGEGFPVRLHLDSLGSGSGGGDIINVTEVSGIEIELDMQNIEVELDFTEIEVELEFEELEIELSEDSLEILIEDDDLDVEI